MSANLKPNPFLASSTTSPGMKLVFRGTAREYFPIWIVNLCLSLATFGIYSAWAKVRKKRYFYSHTTLDGTPFQYLGQPLPILKGRIIAAILLGIYWITSQFFVSVLPWVLLVGFLLLPWVVVRAAAFNARYSAYRNLTFDFDGNYWGAVKAFYLWALIMIPTLGLGFSWWQQRIKRFMVEHYSFGGERGTFSATGGQFFKIYFLAGVLMIVAGLIATGIMFSMPAFSLRYAWIGAIPIYAAYVLAYALTRARLGNLVWNNTTLGPLRFHSTLKARTLAALYFGNALAIIFSAGLLTPWAVIRTMKYRADNMEVLFEGELDDFIGGGRTAVQATGAEVGEFFDFDISL